MARRTSRPTASDTHETQTLPAAVRDREKVLVLQGGGALGAYQAGAFTALSDAGLSPDWVAGTSIGAINCALIAGNPKGERGNALKTFWERVTKATAGLPFVPTGAARSQWNTAAAMGAMFFGVPGFFSPRMPGSAFSPFRSPDAVSVYDTSPLRETLLELVDFDLLNDGPVRVSLGAVNVENGNMVYFDSETTRLGPEHIMASGALPPAFAPIEIDGALYWDGGLVSNAPLQYVLEEGVRLTNETGNGSPMLIFQVDLFSASGAAPRTLGEIEAREKDIRFSSRTRAATQRMEIAAQVAKIARSLGDKLPAEWRDDPDLKRLMNVAANTDVTLLHLIYRQAAYENGQKDYEFSRASMREHWQAGERDVRRIHAKADWDVLLAHGEGMKSFDLGRQ
ncbi:patatin-like phospholipase family protein [Thioclava sp. BHET1]|nr:patatin-like phospholipase family protein [Thioclava sp. BHET1]